jgi:uroporphyrinogen-III decarboxylase
MSANLTSRERLLRAMRCQDVDHTPCAFMSFAALRGRCQDAYEVARQELAWGLDSWIFAPPTWRNERPNHPDLRGLPVRLPPDVTVELWLEDAPDDGCPVLHKTYHMPAGTLTTSVRKTADWPHGDFVPLVDDYQVPRALKPLVTDEADVEVMRHLLILPTAEEIATFRGELARARAFAAAHGVIVASGWGVGADMAGWLCGLEQLALLAVDRPALVEDLLAIIGRWNEARMRAVLEAGVDLYIRRGWYESAQFWSPRLYRRFILPWLQREAALAHAHGALFGYIMTAGLTPMLDLIAESGVDVLLGLDPLQGGPDPLAAARDRLAGRVCLWGGVNAALTVEAGSADDVAAAVGRALEAMTGANGFILSPVDNVTRITRNVWRNVDVFIETWRRSVGLNGF